MKKPIFKTISLILAFTHLISFCLRDADLAFAKEKEIYSSSDLSDAIHAEFVPNEMMQNSVAQEEGGAAMMAFSGAAGYSSTVPPATIQAAVGLNASVLTSFQNDIFTGRSTLSVPISAPAGRKGIKPNISINYSSGSGNGFVGVGWSLEMGAIERSVKKGLPNYTSSDTFLFNSGSGQGEFTSIGSGEYRAKIEGAFQKIYFNGSSWEVKDKSGTTYIYGEDSAHRIESSGKIFKWCLQKITDVFGNYMLIDYISDSGQLYPYQIRYAGNSEFELEPTNMVEMTYSSDRADRIVSYRSGFRIETNKLLSDIIVYANGQRQGRYKFEYEDNSTNIRSLLKKVTQYGMDDSISMPEIIFEYNYHQLGWDTSSVYLPQESQLGPFSYLADANNDGYVDIFRHYYLGDYRWVRHSFLGEQGGWSETSDWYPPEGMSFGWPAETLRDNGVRLVDVNGDGFVDIIQHLTMDHGGRSKGVYLNNKSNGWVSDSSWSLPDDTVLLLCHVTDVPMEWREYLGVVFSDINADGYVDILRARGGERYTYINTHSGWYKDSVWAMPDGDLSNGSTQFGDLNADGLLDFLIMDGSRRDAYVNTGAGWTRESSLDPSDGNFSDGSTQLIDINEDGFADIVIAKDSQRRTFLN
ncbi:MAG: VCBS repeat-containing protein, partial [Candidatus Omnitrophica bacterium]|nr:VCBS repeat-containing protein [Candidatus Omnitrophota bacterium]